MKTRIPEFYKDNYLKAMGANGAKPSKAAAIKAKCLDCRLYQRRKITNCPENDCPLYPHRPYRMKFQRSGVCRKFKMKNFCKWFIGLFQTKSKSVLCGECHNKATVYITYCGTNVIDHPVCNTCLDTINKRYRYNSQICIKPV